MLGRTSAREPGNGENGWGNQTKLRDQTCSDVDQRLLAKDRFKLRVASIRSSLDQEDIELAERPMLEPIDSLGKPQLRFALEGQGKRFAPGISHRPCNRLNLGQLQRNSPIREDDVEGLSDERIKSGAVDLVQIEHFPHYRGKGSALDGKIHRLEIDPTLSRSTDYPHANEHTEQQEPSHS